jgi:hypothetical protein
MTRFGALFAPWVLSSDGIAYDPRHDRLVVTGKQWPTVFELKVIQTHSWNFALSVKASSDC